MGGPAHIAGLIFPTIHKVLQYYPSSFSLRYAREFSTGLDRYRSDWWYCFQTGFTDSSSSNCFGLFLKKKKSWIFLLWRGDRVRVEGNPKGSTTMWASKIVCIFKTNPGAELNCDRLLWHRMLHTPGLSQGLTSKQHSVLCRCHFLSDPKTLSRCASCMVPKHLDMTLFPCNIWSISWSIYPLFAFI